MLSDTMTAIEITAPGGPEVLRPTTRPMPHPMAGEILIKVTAAGVNRPDVLQRSGAYPPPPGASDLPGLECAGTVAAVGPGVTRWQIGEPVCALLPGGGYAEFALTHQDHALPIPKGLSMTEAAGLPETFFTVWTNVFDRARLKAGETFLVHGGSSGIGTTAIQLAHAFGARVLTTAGSEEKCRFCEDLGAERAINYRTQDFVEITRDATGGQGADVILDMVGGDYVARNIKALATEGRLCQIAFLSGAETTLNLAPLMMKRATLTGSTLRPRSIQAKAEIATALHKQVWPLIEQSRVRPIINATFPLREAAKAHALMESSGHIGKIILEV